MFEIYEGCCVAMVIFILDYVYNYKKDVSYYLAIAFLFAGLFFANPSKLHAQESCEYQNYTYCFDNLIDLPASDIFDEIEDLKSFIRNKMIDDEMISDADRQRYVDKSAYHLTAGNRCIEEARQMCWYLPNISDRQKAEECFNSAIATICTKGLKSKGVAALVVSLAQYGLDCLREWNAIETKLKRAKYHYEMYEFYEDLLSKC